MLLIVVISFPAQSRAGFDVTSWQLLRSVVVDNQGSDVEIIGTVSNPFQSNVTAQIGLDNLAANYDFIWDESPAIGDFNTSLTHEIRSPGVRIQNATNIYILPTEPVAVTIEGRLDYAHTPGDQLQLKFLANILNLTTIENEFTGGAFTGEGFSGPSSDTVFIDAEIILQPGMSYRLSHLLESSNQTPIPANGIFDATGFVNYSIRPVPEPATACLTALLTLPFVFRKSRRVPRTNYA